MNVPNIVEREVQFLYPTQLHLTIPHELKRNAGESFAAIVYHIYTRPIDNWPFDFSCVSVHTFPVFTYTYAKSFVFLLIGNLVFIINWLLWRIGFFDGRTSC